MTNEILLEAFKRLGGHRNHHLDILESFLHENFHLATDAKSRKQNDYPTLPLLLSLIDLGIDKRQPFKPLTGTKTLVSRSEADR